jgi:copper chaperone
LSRKINKIQRRVKIMSHVELKVEGMSCNHCVVSIEGALKKIGSKGEVDLANDTVSVEYDENKLSLDKIKEAIEDQGYEVV